MVELRLGLKSQNVLVCVYQAVSNISLINICVIISNEGVLLKFIYTKDSSQRADLVVLELLNISRNQAQNLIKNGLVFVDEKVVTKSGFMVEKDSQIHIKELKKDDEDELNLDFAVDILYEDEYILIINKPPNLTTHKAPSVNEVTLVDWLVSKNFKLSCVVGEDRRGIVHRLDKETSGALIIAKDDSTHEKLSNKFKKQNIGRYYLAIIDLPLRQSLIVDRKIARNMKNRLKMSINSEGKESKSAFIKLKNSKNMNYELIAAKLFSGRTHQIRVHLKSLSRHILGDDLYGFKSQKVKIPRVMLHAFGLSLTHPVTNEPLQICAPLFEDFKTELLNYFEGEIDYEKISLPDIINLFDTVCFGVSA